VAAEALLRWMRPDGERIRAAEFMPIAEELGILGELGDFALRLACQQRAAWLAQGFSDFRVAVNIGSLQLQKRDFAAHVESVLSQTNLPPRFLEIEFTESSLIDSLHVASKNLSRLGELDVQLSLDDFGVGYASLAYLQRFPFQNVKVDRTLLADLHPGSRETRNLRGLLALLREMGMRSVAEGVEDPKQLRFLQALGFDLAQGFSLGRPMCPADLTHLLGAEAKLHKRVLTKS
jgi:EAL domain-containing protein (putative c-di-GMP-specific phosphodiesterase class I)